MRIYDLKQKEVINECDCRRLGFVMDIEFDISTGCLTAIIIPGESKFYGFLGREKEYIIPVSCIKQIGDDVIIVSVNIEEVMVNC